MCGICAAAMPQDAHRAGGVKALHDIKQLLVRQRVTQLLEQAPDLRGACRTTR